MLLANPQISNSKILIVDDTLQNVLVLKEILNGCGQIYFSDSAKDALKLIPDIMPDVILLDIEMPEMDGWTLCKKLKQDSQFANIPIIFITGHDDPTFEKLSLELGGVDFITKPFAPSICKLRVQNQLKLYQQNRLISQAREQLQALVKQVPVLITYWDAKWNNLFSNDYSGSWFKLVNKANSSFTIDDAFPIDLSNAIKSNESTKDELTFTVQTELDGSTCYYQVFQSQFYTDNKHAGYLVTLVDISEVRQAKQALYSEKERLRVSLNSIGDAVIATDNNGKITFMNPVAERMTGWRFRDAKDEKIEQVMPLRDASDKHPLLNPLYIALREQRTVAMALNSELVSRNGSVYAVEDSAAPIRDDHGKIIGGIIVFHDVSETMAMAIKMSHLANHDQLTDLPNRVLLQDRLTVACSNAAAKNQKACLLLIDIDHFKYINDSLGHQLGDELICLMANRLKAILPQSYTLARLGGDEFVILMNDTTTAGSASALASNLLNVLHEQFTLEGQSYSVSVSMGLSVFPDDASNPEELMRHADVAMYRAKQDGRNRFRFFSDELEYSLIQRHQLETKLRRAIINDDIMVYFQPKFDLVTQQMVGAEALARLMDDDGNLISPQLFIPLAEESGLIVELGKQVLFKSCAMAKKLYDCGANIPISVNVAAAQFSSNDLEGHIKLALCQYQLPAELLELEVTETALMVDAESTKATLEKLKSFGISISIDDFGTGYSSLAYLKMFNVDIMKIDMSFVRDMLINKHDYEIVKTIITLGLSMNLTLVAEGVETHEQQEELIKLGCHIGQGYVFSKPITSEEFFILATK